MSRTRGFTLVELLFAMAITTTCAGVLLSLVLAGQRIARMQPEAADQQQRARTAIQTLGTELALAGAGLDGGAKAGSLAQYFPPILPSADGGMTIWYLEDATAQATLAAALDPASTIAPIAAGPICAPAQPACAFSADTTAVLFDAASCRDVGRIEQVTADAVILRSTVRGCAYAAGAPIAQGHVRTYRVDAASRQLLRRDEATGSSQPVLDNVAAMTVEYLDSGRRVRVTLRFVATLLQVPEFVLALDVSPPNVQDRW